MKNFSLLPVFAAFFLLFSCGPEKGEEGKTDTSLINVSASSNGTSNGQLPVIKFEETEHDFGKLTQGERVKWTFKFTNEGNAQLVVSNVSTTCGCTIADKPKDPIPPGKTGTIDVEFNSENKSGEVSREITVVSNCEPNATTLKIKANVIVPTEKYSNETK